MSAGLAPTDPEYAKQLQCDEWEVVVPELVFEPSSDSRHPT